MLALREECFFVPRDVSFAYHADLPSRTPHEPVSHIPSLAKRPTLLNLSQKLRVFRNCLEKSLSILLVDCDREALHNDLELFRCCREEVYERINMLFFEAWDLEGFDFLGEGSCVLLCELDETLR